MSTTPALAYLELIKTHIDAVRADVPKLTAFGEAMARPLVGGGRLFTPKVGPFWPSEFMNRAGGLMGIEPADAVPDRDGDVAFIALPDERKWKPADDATFQKLVQSPAQIFAIGRAEDLPGGVDVKRFSGFTGGVGAREGLFASEKLKPLAPLRQFAQLVRGWIAGGEMVSAMTRAEKMPILWMSVWLEGALVRNAVFYQHNNRIEPWATKLFHDDHYVPPLAPGYAAGEFLGTLSMIHGQLIEQKERLAKAGNWLADAARAGKRPNMVAVGHSYPMILELEDPAHSPLGWNPSISDLRYAHPNELAKGDDAIHFGYSPVKSDHVEALLNRGIRFIYSSPYGRPATLRDHPNLIWLDLPWRPSDATVDIPGYSVRMLPMSSSAHTMVYFAIVSEMADKMGWV
jgi:hypothetical protein